MFRFKNKGFTLIELLVIIAIIGLLAVIVLVNVNNARQKAEISKTQADLEQIYKAIEFLYDDTEEYPAHCLGFPPCSCSGGPERVLDACTAGLECTDGGFPNWDGPYVSKIPKDPWGNSYIFDADYRCNTGVKGCEGIPDGATVRAIHSGGPNGSGINIYDADNIVSVLCR